MRRGWLFFVATVVALAPPAAQASDRSASILVRFDPSVKETNFYVEQQQLLDRERRFDQQPAKDATKTDQRAKRGPP